MNQITPREYAAKHKVPYSTVLTWIKTGKLSANKQTTPHGIFYSVEKNTARPMTRRGPKLKGKTT